MLKDKDKERYFDEARKFNKKIFASKDKMRKVWARQPMDVPGIDGRVGTSLRYDGINPGL